MTCIIGLVENGKVYIGADSAGVKHYNSRIRKDSKVFVKNEMVFGFTSSFRMGQLIRYSFKIPDHLEYINDHEYLCTDFMSSLIKCFEENKFAREDNKEVFGGEFLIGYKGKLYKVCTDFQVGIVGDNYDTCGCGEEFALGAMKQMENETKYSPEEKIKSALSIAEYFSSGVRSPYNIVSI